jgi:hypothetical protein
MPAPNPHALWLAQIDNGHVRMSYSAWPWGNLTLTRRRAERLARLYLKGRTCAHCGALIDPCKRIDAVYCREGCRKAAARLRRRQTETVQIGFNPNNSGTA